MQQQNSQLPVGRETKKNERHCLLSILVVVDIVRCVYSLGVDGKNRKVLDRSLQTGDRLAE